MPEIGIGQKYTQEQDSHRAQEGQQSMYQSSALGPDPSQTQETKSAYAVGQEPYQADEHGHGPYQPHEPGYGLYQPGFSPYDDQIPDPKSRMLAIQNAKAYLMKSSATSGLNL